MESLNMALTVYLAGPYVARETLAGYGRELEQIGYRFRARWCDGTHEVGPHGAVTEAAPEDRIRWAREDLQDVARADVLVFFTAASVLPASDVGTFGTSGGRHVETGYALALDKRVVLVGEPENVFHWLPQIVRCPDWHAALILLGADLVAHHRDLPRATPDEAA